jgi:hypothetical protein
MVIHRNENAGRFFFSKGAMKGFSTRFFDSAVITDSGLTVFLISDSDGYNPRFYQVCLQNPDGTIAIRGDKFKFYTKKNADSFMQLLITTLDYIGSSHKFNDFGMLHVIQVCQKAHRIYVWSKDMHIIRVYGITGLKFNDCILPYEYYNDVEGVDSYITRLRWDHIKKLDK